MESFSGLGLAESLASALASFGFQGPTRVQAEAIPAILARRDAILESETGTGKTFAYLAPALQMVSVLERRRDGEPGVLVAAPTQELAVQIGREAERLAKAAGLSARIAVLLGGTPLEKQAVKLKEKPDIVVGTIGRLADLAALRRLRTSSLKMLVLDEADRLFTPETEDLTRALLEGVPSSCARVLASATMPERARREAGPYLRDPADICPGGEGVLSGSIEHWCFYCDGRKRLDFARRFEAAVRPERCLMFMSAAGRIEKAAAALAKLGLPIEAIHGGMDKEARRVALERFSEGKVRYLLTSDLGARGLDIPGVTHVISLDLPEEPTVYTHRAGRTGRAGATGVSIALADGVELARASKIAVRGGFVFRCKDLERGAVVEPTSEEFFGRAEASEEERRASKAARVADGERRGPKGRDGSRFRRESAGRSEGAARGDDAAPRRPFAGGARERSGERPAAAARPSAAERPSTAERSAAAPSVRPAASGPAARGDRGAPRARIIKKERIEERRSPIEPQTEARADDRPQTSAPRPSAPRGSGPRPDAPRSGAPRPSAPRDAASRPYASRPGAPRPGEPRADRPRQSAPRGGRPDSGPRGQGRRSAAGAPRSGREDRRGPAGSKRPGPSSGSGPRGRRPDAAKGRPR